MSRLEIRLPQLLISNPHLWWNIVPISNWVAPIRAVEQSSLLPRAVFELAGVDLSKPTVLMCGGAVVAPFVAFAASLIGIELPVYDVSLTYCVSLVPSPSPYMEFTLRKILQQINNNNYLT